MNMMDQKVKILKLSAKLSLKVENTPISRRDHRNSKKQMLLGLDRAKVKAFCTKMLDRHFTEWNINFQNELHFSKKI